MVVKIINGMRIHEPPYTQAEDDEFYKRVGRGPVTVAHPAGDRKASERDNDGSGTDHRRTIPHAVLGGVFQNHGIPSRPSGWPRPFSATRP